MKFYLYIFTLLISCSFFITSCSTSGPGLFGKKSLHEQYGNKLKDAGLTGTALGNQWFYAAENALNAPSSVILPYKEVGYFAADKPRAMGLKFSAKRGEKLLFRVDKKPVAGFALYMELWQVNESAAPSLLHSLDTTNSGFEHEVNKDGSFILRLQPELLKGGEYTLSISIGATLAFPVPGNNGRIGSFWGASRDAGARSHEGIDIFAPRRTPVVAAYDGTVTRVNENNLGGKVVWMRPEGKDITLYYAHLDEQLASSGQRVKQGDTIGLIGNTGNAVSTAPHLHFGIYTFGGAIDPLPFVNPSVRNPSNVTVSVDRLRNTLRLKNNVQLKTSSRSIPLSAKTIVAPLAVSSKDYRVELPDGTITDFPVAAIEPAENSLKQVKLKTKQFILDQPNSSAPRKLQVDAAETIQVLGYYNGFAYVRSGETEGWMSADAL